MRLMILLLAVVNVAFGQLALRDAQYFEPIGSFKNPLFAEGLEGWTVTGNCGRVMQSKPLSRVENPIKFICNNQSFSISQEVDIFKGKDGMLLESIADITNNLNKKVNIKLEAGSEIIWEYDADSGKGDYPYLFINRDAENLKLTISTSGATGDFYLNRANIKKSFINDNAVDSRLSPNTAWTAPQPLSITAQTTNPTKGAIEEDYCIKKRDGSDLLIRFRYVQSGGGSTGSGRYFFSCGDNTFNGETITVRTGAGYESLGSGYVDATITTIIQRENTLSWYMTINGMAISHSNKGLSGGVQYNGTLRIPIKEWQPSTRAITTKHDYFDLKNHSLFSATLTASPTIAHTSHIGWIESITKVGTGNFTVNFKPGLFSTPPICVATVASPATATNDTIKVSNLTVNSTEIKTAKDKAASDLNYTFTCTKTGKDLQDAWSPVKVAPLARTRAVLIARTDTGTIANNSWYTTMKNFSHIVADTHSAFNNSTGMYNMPFDGVCTASAGFSLPLTSSPSPKAMAIMGDSNNIAINTLAYSHSHSISVYATIKVHKGEKIHVGVDQYSGSAATVLSNPAANYFTLDCEPLDTL